MRSAECVYKLLFLCAIPVANAVSAQVLEEVIVTAQKREQSTQDVGIAITAFTGDQIRDLGFTNSVDVVAMTPGVQFNQTTGESGWSFSVRGVTQSDFADHQESPVSVYVDEAYISQNPATGFALFDLDRVEVLRGPQGTLFGRNATGGLIHFVTKKPTEEFDAYVDLTGGSEGTLRIESALGGALGETVNGRLSVLWDENDTYKENSTGRDGGDRQVWSVRGQIAFALADAGEFLLKAESGRFETDAPYYWQWDGLVGPDADGLPQLLPPGPDRFGYQDLTGDPHDGAWDATGGYYTEHSGLTATINYGFESFDFVSVTNFQDLDKEFIGDTDSGPTRSDTNPIPGFNPLTMMPTGTGGVGQMHYGNDTEADQWSQELRLNSDWDNGRWIAGIYYLSIDGLYEQYVGFSPDTPFQIGGNPIASQETTSWAVFGQLEFDLSDQLTAIIGARYTDDEVEVAYLNQVQAYIDGTNGDNRVTLVPNIAAFNRTQNEELVTAKAELDWTPNDDWLVYVSWNRGVKGGGFNHPLVPAQFPDAVYSFDPEVLNAYEVGVKGTLGDIGRLNAAAYVYDYTDYQAYQLIPGVAQNVFNRDAEIAGVEVDLLLHPSEGWDIALSASYVDATVKDVQLPTRVADRKPTKIPENTASALIRYSWEAFGGILALQADANYQSEHFFDILNAPAQLEGGYTAANLRATYTSDDERWSLAAYVDNVTDEEYRVSAFALDNPVFMSLNKISNFARPRWYGVVLRYHWD